ncbi:hypothetical protein [Cupriavidus sp. YAF13]|uniref:hypothetical protein n=1 Tax=Cupriavidus sp. YAF13 TaxID=3233075 RepID=UPI003F91C0B9
MVRVPLCVQGVMAPSRVRVGRAQAPAACRDAAVSRAISMHRWCDAYADKMRFRFRLSDFGRQRMWDTGLL